ncbi:flavocytochrome c [Proteinivorax hydrogeniformans]|uniref:Urocanate reductase n=1 Tax=Proteinivorax hydrogeniformans TaxID=1826727 RepID=A0AAU8HUN2_9FIRM
MKKTLMLLLAVMLMATTVVGCGSDAIYKSGTYEGVGEGYSGKIVVEVEVSDTEIKEVKILEFNDSDFALEPAKQLIEAVIGSNNTEVDVISGATETSNGVLEAIEDALLDARISDAPAKTNNNQEEEELEDLTTDVVVIGAGGAGLTAAIEAKANGADVIVVEKMPLIGGNTKLATGGLNAAESSVQSELDITDSVELFMEDIMTGGGEINDQDLVDILASESAETVDWLIELGVDLSDIGRMGGASADRTHRPTGGDPVGDHLVEILYENATNMGIEVLLNSEVIEVTGDDNGVSGVIAKTAGGEFSIDAKAVVIASGGFGADNEVVASYDESLEGYGTTNHPGATGDALGFTKNLNVDFVDMNEIQTHPTVMPSNNFMITEAVRGNGAILVNREGERFVSELGSRAEVSNAQLEQTGSTSFLVFDQGIRESLGAIDGYYNNGFLVKGETISDLASELDIEASALESTIETYNGYVASENDEDYSRQDMPRSLETGPYYAVEVGPAVHHTMGGVRITTESEVLNTDGKVIPGLYAAGEVTGAIHGNNRLGGNALTDITVFGRIAGVNAAKSSN